MNAPNLKGPAEAFMIAASKLQDISDGELRAFGEDVVWLMSQYFEEMERRKYLSMSDRPITALDKQDTIFGDIIAEFGVAPDWWYEPPAYVTDQFGDGEGEGDGEDDDEVVPEAPVVPVVVGEATVQAPPLFVPGPEDTQLMPRIIDVSGGVEMEGDAGEGPAA
ncbi:hypothetical protein [Amycolatopsis sp. DSM 110486]|uniref:hypothetical protein n=1 Tax=Amycolatopsis sp. DSM 110486 TaxID=2865832 RepID=UPI001C694DD8|nr:hypothetical protein [Amycolatopsis sp. DSM 110486]QYN17446.1 hypothetical protein K1T34_32180 [Amycolatopsis sp. DSM 110486]